MVLVIALIIFNITTGKSKIIKKSPFPVEDFRGNKCVFLAMNTEIAAAQLLADLFFEETKGVVQVEVALYESLLHTILDDAGSVDPKFDVVQFAYSDLARLVDERVLLDLTEFIYKNNYILQSEDFFPDVLDAYANYKGKYWAIPYDLDLHLLFYRKSLLKKYDYPPPETWNDVRNIAKTITEKEDGVYGIAMMAYPVPLINISTFFNRLTAYGGYFFDAENKPAINSPEAIEALSSLIGLIPYALPTPLETDHEVSRDAFLTGRVAMADQWSSLGVDAEESGKSVVKGDWGVVPLPRGSGPKAVHPATLNAGFSLGLSAKSKKTNIAKSFIRFAGRPDIQKRLNLTANGIDVCRISIIKSKEFREYNPAIAASTENAFLKGKTVGWPLIPELTEILDVLSANIAEAMRGEKSPKDALDNTQAKWLDILKKKH